MAEDKTITIKIKPTMISNMLHVGNNEFRIEGIILESDVSEKIQSTEGTFEKYSFVALSGFNVKAQEVDV